MRRQRLPSVIGGKRKLALSLVCTLALAAGVTGGVFAQAAAEAGRPGRVQGVGTAQGDESPTLSGVVELVRRESPDGDVVDSAMYGMLGEQTAFDWPLGNGSGATASGMPVFALPALSKDPTVEGVSSHIAVANVIPKPGFTDFVIFIYDQQGLLDYICEKLNERQTEYIDIDTWGYVNHGFRGHAIVSAVFWEHDVYEDDGTFVRNLVGLSGAVVHHPLTVVSGQSTAIRGLPIHSQLGLDLAPFENHPPMCPSLPGPRITRTPTRGPSPAPSATPTITLTPSITPTPSAAPPYSLVSPEVHIPVLRDRGPFDVCQTQIRVQNLGPKEAKAALVVWGGGGDCGRPDAGPIAVVCSGLLIPGGSWVFTSPNIHAQARSATVYSLNTDGWEFTPRNRDDDREGFGEIRFNDVGGSGWSRLPGGDGGDVPPRPRSDDIVADVICETLRFGAVGNEANYLAFKRAYDSGWEWAGISQKLWGPALAVRVERNCTGSEGPFTGALSEYAGVSGPMLGYSGSPSTSYEYSVPQLGGAADGSWWVHIQNAGSDCAEARLFVFAQDETAGAGQCGSASVAPGETMSFGPHSCPDIAGAASAVVFGSGPLAVAVDVESGGHQSSYSAAPKEWRLPSGEPLLADRDAVGYAPLVFKNHHGWSTRLHVQNTDTVSSTLVATFLDRSGDVAGRYQFGPVRPKTGLSIDVETIGGLPYWWIGSARVESFPLSDGAVATPWTPQPTSTAEGTSRPTRTPYTPRPTSTRRPGYETATATAGPEPTNTPYVISRLYIPIAETSGSF